MPSQSSPQTPRVYISYSHDSDSHVKRVLELANRLRDSGIDCKIDQYDLSPSENLTSWYEQQMEAADFVVIVCTKTYSSRFSGEEQSSRDPGALVEGKLISRRIQDFYGKPRFVPVIFELADRESIPLLLRSYNHCDLSSEDGYRRLIRLLTGTPAANAPPRGVTKQAATKTSKTKASQESASQTSAEEGRDPEDSEEGEGGSVNFDTLDPGNFTEYGWSVLQVARRLGASRPRPSVCSTSRMLAALILSGLQDKRGEYTGGWLIRQLDQTEESIKKLLGGRYPLIKPRSSFGTLLKADEVVAPSMTARLKDTIDIAQRLAVDSLSRKRRVLISARHLLGAALRRSEGSSRFFRNFGLTSDDLRARLLDQLPDWQVEDDPGVWRRILDSVQSAPLEHGLPVYASDSAAGTDFIGITREVEAMASLVSAWSVEPPLSIGLFGEWGSGKSFFMQKMKERVRQIASAARKSGVGQKEFGYYKNIVQVEFNAWHYVEGNLWASLVEHIFSNLRLEGIGEEDVDSEEYIKQRLEKLLGQVKEKTAEVIEKEKAAEAASKEAQEKKKQTEQAAQDLEKQAQDALKRAKDAEEKGREAKLKAADKQREVDAVVLERNRIGIRDILEELNTEEIRNLVEKDMEALGFTRERMATVQGLRESLKEASETSMVLREGISIVTNDKQRWRLLPWVLIGPLAAWALLRGGAWLIAQQDAAWLQSVTGAVSVAAAFITTVVGFWNRYSPKLKPVLDTVARLKDKRAEVEKRVEAAREQRAARAALADQTAREKMAEAEREAKLAEQQMAQAQKARQEAKDKQDEADRAAQIAAAARVEAEKLQREALALRPEQRIAAFIQDRAGAKDYRRHLGVPALIRRDFEKLSAMFRSQRDEEKGDADGRNQTGRNDLAIVNRIILYIDDLDRCPPEKVVEVLRAIHLLLAFPLFVVIVAVDARWMKRSLRDRFALMLTSPDSKVDVNKAALREEELMLGSMATPDDYLEKIFQVPFWIRPLGAKACRNLVNALTRSDVEAESEATPAANKLKVLKTTGDEKAAEAVADAKNVLTRAAVATGAGDNLNINAAADQAKGETRTKPEPDKTVEGESGTGFAWSLVEPTPRTLQLTKEERDYMVELAPVIGRSPRSVKRYVNCYRLLKSALDKDELARVTQDGTFRTTMLLLGLVTGLPELAPSLLSDLRSAEKNETPAVWAQEAGKRLAFENRERWDDLLPALVQLKEISHVSTLRPLVRAADLVDRFSFSPIRSAPPDGLA